MAGVLFCAVVVDVGQGGTSQTHPYTHKHTKTNTFPVSYSDLKRTNETKRIAYAKKSKLILFCRAMY